MHKRQVVTQVESTFYDIMDGGYTRVHRNYPPNLTLEDWEDKHREWIEKENITPFVEGNEVDTSIHIYRGHWITKQVTLEWRTVA